jgi:hypothetical protein
MERRSRSREVGESIVTIPPKRTSIFFFKGLDDHFVPMVPTREPGYDRKRFPRALFVGMCSR